MQRKIERMRRHWAGCPRYLACVISMLCLVVVMSPAVFAVNVVTVTDTESEEDIIVLTTSDTAHEILQLAGVETRELDQVLVTSTGGEIEEVVVQRNYTFPVTLQADGIVYSADILEGTVETLLTQCGVTLGEEDYTNYPLDTVLEPDMAITVNRITYGTEVLRVELEEAVVDEYIATLGEDVVFKKSDLSQYDVTYLQRYDNGTLVSSEIQELMPIFGVRGEGTTSFISGVAISRIEGFEDITLGADGLPTEYNYVMNSAVATAYSSSGGKGASGLGLYYGTVAVDPSKIPYGTRLYITSADGSFVYGFAIATDTGSAMREGYVDIDLYFETNAECLVFGKRSLVVYVLD